MLYVACGSRRFRDPLVATKTIVDRIRMLPSGGMLVHGNAPGADRLCGRAAELNGMQVRAIKADWQTHGDNCHCKGQPYCKEAGFRRNLEMLDMEPALVIAFWNGISNGTLHTITNAKNRGLNLEVIRL